MAFSIIVLGAGFGTRMKSKKAKIMHEICNKPMIFYILEKLSKLSADIHLVLGHQKEIISPLIAKNFPSVNLHFQDILHFPGTGGALFGIKPKFEKTLILCADMPLIENASLLRLASSDEDLALCAFIEDRPNEYGRVFKGSVGVKIIEFKDADEVEKEHQLCNAGVYAIKTELLHELLPRLKNDNAAGEYYLTDLVSMLTHAQVLEVDKYEFMGVNDKVQLCTAEEYLQAKIKEKWMREGVIFHLPSTSYISLDTVFKGECEVYENVRFEGKCMIINSVIKSSSVIEESVLDDSVVGPLAHIRPKCTLKASMVGNFTETKNAKITGAKASHLSYLGDCEVGEGSNIGCGTITCNYDGVKKHTTLIGKNVFVGSNSNLIAPIKLEDGCTVAAGSCVTKDVPAGSLYINRAKDYIKTGYKKHEK